MLIRTIENKKSGRKWEIYKNGEDNYSYKYFEFFQCCGWRQYGSEENYTKDAIEWEFDIEIA